MLAKLTRRMKSDEGFTLIELLIVLIIIAILIAIAVPSYLTFKERAENRSAGANVRAAVPSAEAFYADADTYTGISGAALKTIDAGLKVVAVDANVAGDQYCIVGTHNGSATGAAGGKRPHWFLGPGGSVVDASPAAFCPDGATAN
jgi:prepilin-type N-terminal cleavage/methylation domain-containing protein